MVIDNRFPLHTRGAALLRAISIAALCILTAVVAVAADESPWRRYENDYFVAYSNADVQQVETILESFEQFRAAAFQIPSFVIPEGRPKTMVILPATRDEFLTFTFFESVAGFSTVLAGQPTIVLPANDPGMDIRVIIGHEFAHTLLFNDFFTYPPWYAEGFAEIASSIVIDRKDSTFVIGARKDLRDKAAHPALDWNSLVDEGFNAHALGDIELTASAYAQNWLLVHYLTLNESRDFAAEMNRYFANVNNGLSGRTAFAQAFGKPAADYGHDDLPGYLKTIANQTFPFEPSLQDLNFQDTAAIDADIQPILNFLKGNADIRHGRNAPPVPRDHLAGRWDWLRLDDPCSDPITFRLRDDDVLVLEAFYSDDETDPVPALFNIEASDDGALELTNITAAEYPEVKVASDYRVTMKSPDVMCFDVQPAARDCLRALYRCR